MGEQEKTIREARLHKGYSQQKVADLLGMSIGQYWPVSSRLNREQERDLYFGGMEGAFHLPRSTIDSDIRRAFNKGLIQKEVLHDDGSKYYAYKLSR